MIHQARRGKHEWLCLKMTPLVPEKAFLNGMSRDNGVDLCKPLVERRPRGGVTTSSGNRFMVAMDEMPSLDTPVVDP